jgi:hypothetical protein
MIDMAASAVDAAAGAAWGMILTQGRGRGDDWIRYWLREGIVFPPARERRGMVSG